MASAGAGITTQVSTPSNEGNTPPVTEVVAPNGQGGPSKKEVSEALAAASEPGSTQAPSKPITPRLLAEQGAESVRENIHPFFKALHNVLKIFRFFTPRGLVEWFVEMMKNKKEMSREATPA